MKATFNPSAKRKFTSSHRKQGKEFNTFAILTHSKYNNKRAAAPVELRVYFGPSNVYACLWIYDNPLGISTEGSGFAGGYGYHKASEAAGEAIQNAGFELSENISGVGDEAIEEALQAIAECVGITDGIFFRAHS